MRRRTLLAGLGATSVAGVVGYASGHLSWTPAGPALDTTRPSEPVRCRGDPVVVERTAADVPGYGTGPDDNFEYYPENGTVRYVSEWQGDEPYVYGEMSFEEWASMECARLGVERVDEVTAERLGTDEFVSARSQPPSHHPSRSLVVLLSVPSFVTALGDGVRSGDPASAPAVSLRRLADVAPRSVEATVSLSGDSYTRTIPVFAEHFEMMAAD